MKRDSAFATDHKALMEWVRKAHDLGTAPRPHFQLEESLIVWLYRSSLWTRAMGDSSSRKNVIEKIKRIDASAFAINMLEFLELGTKKNKDAFQKLQKAYKSKIVSESAWDWYWDLEFLEQKQLIENFAGDLHACIATNEQILEIAIKNADVACALETCYWLFFIYDQVGNRTLRLTMLGKLGEIAKAENYTFYLSKYYSARSFHFAVIADYPKALRDVRKAMREIANLGYSMQTDHYRYFELQYLNLLGRYRDFYRVIDHLRESIQANQREPDDYVVIHMAIELFESFAWRYDLVRAKRCLEQYRIIEHRCCRPRIYLALLQLETYKNSKNWPLEDYQFFQDSYDNELLTSDNLEFEKVRIRIFRLKYALKKNRWQKEHDAEFYRLGKWVEASPYPVLEFQWQKLLMERSILAKAYQSAWSELDGCIRLARRIKLNGEYACLLKLREKLAGKLSIEVSLSRSESLIVDAQSAEYLNNYLQAWPCSVLDSSESSVNLVWDSRANTLIISGVQRIAFKTRSPLAKLAQELVRIARTRKRPTVTYERLFNSIWNDSFDPLRHEHKLQSLVSKFKAELREHGVENEFLQNVYGYGYRIGAIDRPDRGSMESSPSLRELLILELLAERTNITAIDICQMFHYSVRQAQRDLKALEHKGKIRAIGGKRNRSYVNIDVAKKIVSGNR